MNSQWFSSSTLMTPHRFWRPRTCWPLTMIDFSEPTTAKGTRFWNHALVWPRHYVPRAARARTLIWVFMARSSSSNSSLS